MALLKKAPNVWGAIKKVGSFISEKTGIGTGYDYNLDNYVQWHYKDLRTFVEKHLPQICRMEGLTPEEFELKYARQPYKATEKYTIDSLKEAWKESAEDVFRYKRIALSAAIAASVMTGTVLFALADPLHFVRYGVPEFTRKLCLAGAGVSILTTLTPLVGLRLSLNEKLYNAQLDSYGRIAHRAPGSRWVTRRADRKVDRALGRPVGFKKLVAYVKDTPHRWGEALKAKPPVTSPQIPDLPVMKYVPPPTWDPVNP